MDLKEHRSGQTSPCMADSLPAWRSDDIRRRPWRGVLMALRSAPADDAVAAVDLGVWRRRP